MELVYSKADDYATDRQILGRTKSWIFFTSNTKKRYPYDIAAVLPHFVAQCAGGFALQIIEKHIKVVRT